MRYHNKMMIVDRRLLFVMSFNFTHMDIDHSRAFGIVTRKPKLSWVSSSAGPRR